MRPIFYSLLAGFSLFTTTTFAQTGCPGCTIALPFNLPTDTIYLPKLKSGVQGQLYSDTLSFRMPQTTDPVAAIDSTTPPGFNISEIEIVGIDNLPPGINWQANQLIFDTGSGETDGCIRFCGIPLASDTFVLLVKIKATVLFLSQETSFPMKLYIAPPVSINDGFTMTPSESCGPTEVAFVNNVPSGGQPGYTYTWNFGDGFSFSGENPPPHPYTQPGVYSVQYQAVIDTGGTFIQSIVLDEADCVDQLGLGDPDVYLEIYTVSGELIFSTAAVENVTFPFTMNVNIPLPADHYILSFWDEDGGLKGSDDECGSALIIGGTGGAFSNDGVSGTINLIHPVTEVTTVDTVTIFNKPGTPVISFPAGLMACEGSDSLVLVSSAGSSNQWKRNGEILPGVNNFIFQPTESGNYSVLVTNVYGCTAESQPVTVEFYPLPHIPVYLNYHNRLYVADSVSYTPSTVVQWYFYSAPIAGAVDFQYCAQETGTYGVEVRDTATGCSNYFSQTAVIDPNYDCTVAANDVELAGLRVFPNPAESVLVVAFPSDMTLESNFYDVTGKLLHADKKEQLGSWIYDIGHFPAGIYFLKLSNGKAQQTIRWVKVGN